MEIILTKHSYNRETNHKLTEMDIKIFIRKLLKDFILVKDGFYKFKYDDIHTILKKNKEKVTIITLYPKKKKNLVLNINFQSKVCIYQGAKDNDRGNEELKINKSKRVSGGQFIRLKRERTHNKKSLKIKNKLHRDFKLMIESNNVILKRFRLFEKYMDITEKYFTIKESLNVRYIIEPIKDNFKYVYFLDVDQKLLKTLHIVDFEKYKKELYERREGERKQNDN